MTRGNTFDNQGSMSSYDFQYVPQSSVTEPSHSSSASDSYGSDLDGSVDGSLRVELDSSQRDGSDNGI